MRFSLCIAATLSALSFSAAHADSVRPGNHFYANSTVAPGSLTTIVAASTNTGGIEIRTCDLTVAGNTALNLYGLYPDGTNRSLFHVFSQTSTSQPCPYPIYLPAGVGLATMSSAANSDGINITYDLLN